MMRKLRGFADFFLVNEPVMLFAVGAGTLAGFGLGAGSLVLATIGTGLLAGSLIVRKYKGESV